MKIKLTTMRIRLAVFIGEGAGEISVAHLNIPVEAMQKLSSKNREFQVGNVFIFQKLQWEVIKIHNIGGGDFLEMIGRFKGTGIAAYNYFCFSVGSALSNNFKFDWSVLSEEYDEYRVMIFEVREIK